MDAAQATGLPFKQDARSDWDRLEPSEHKLLKRLVAQRRATLGEAFGLKLDRSFLASVEREKTSTFKVLAYTQAHMHTYMRVCVHTCASARASARAGAGLPPFANTHARALTHTHTHTHTNTHGHT